ncbi:MAG: hypothetical protein M0Z99_03250 [Betaproteobacteria bacterium]|nr:hypothetical protein [Betaproteobacteria bacterium]
MTIQRGFAAAIFLTLMGIVFIEANAEPFGRIFWHLLTIHDQPAALLMLAVLVGGYWAGSRGGGDGLWAERVLLGLDRWRLPWAILLWVVLCAGSVVVYRNHPLSMDEYAAVFQARIFAAGALHGQFPPELLDNLIPRGFQNHFLMVNRHSGAVFSAYWPGFSLLLAPFVWLDIPWVLNPTLVAASLLMIGRIARELIPSSAAAGWAMLFALASPAFVANGITYYSMPAHLLLNLCFVWLLLSRTRWRLFAAGAVGGLALALHNPFPHAVFALPWLFWLATRRGEWHRNLFWTGLGYVATALPLVIGWSLWQRELLLPPATAGVASTVAAIAPSSMERMGLILRGFFRVLQWPHELTIHARLGGLAKLWLWASPLLLLLAWWGGRESKSPPLRLLGASALVTFFAYFLIRFDQGHGWGYRYFHSVWGVLPILGAAGAIKLAAMPGEGVKWSRVLIPLALVSLIGLNGLRFQQMGSFMADHLAQFPPRVPAEFRVVLHNHRGYHGHDLIQNDPWLRGGEIVLLAEGADGRALVDRYFPEIVEVGSNRYGITFVGGTRPP